MHTLTHCAVSTQDLQPEEAKERHQKQGLSICAMLAEGFLRMLLYREERKFASDSKCHKTQTHTHCTDQFNGIVSESDSADLQTDSAEAGKQSYHML